MNTYRDLKWMCTTAHTAHKSCHYVSSFPLLLLCSKQWLGRFGILNASVCLRALRPPRQAPCQFSQPVRNSPNSESWLFGQSIYTIISWALTSWLGRKDIYAALLCRYLVSTRRAISLFLSTREEEHSWYILCSLAELDLISLIHLTYVHLNSPVVKYYVYPHSVTDNSNCNPLHTTVYDHRESPLGCCPTLARFSLYFSH